MNRIIFVIGATATGKTYFINQKFNAKDYNILNVYDYQLKAYDEAGYTSGGIPMDIQFRCLMHANDALLKDIINNADTGKDIVVEHTLFKAKRRIAYIDEIRKTFDGLIQIYVISPEEERWKENIKLRDLSSDSYNSFKKMSEGIEFPNPSEGFDEIYEVKDGIISLRMDEPRSEIISSARKEIQAEKEKIKNEDEAKLKRKKLIDSMNTRKFWHYCEVCGKKEFITAEEAFNSGWDYPPNIGMFGILSPRTCGDCMMQDTLYWKIQTSDDIRYKLLSRDVLTADEILTLERILNEPESLIEE